jgi:hypothetical protein
MSEVYRELKAQLVRRGLTQKVAARRVGCSEFRLWRLLHCRARPTLREQRRLARILALPEADVFPGTPNGTGKAGRPRPKKVSKYTSTVVSRDGQKGERGG